MSKFCMSSFICLTCVPVVYILAVSHMTDALCKQYVLAWGRLGCTNGVNIKSAHRRATKLLINNDQKLFTFHSIYDYFALFRGII